MYLNKLLCWWVLTTVQPIYTYIGATVVPIPNQPKAEVEACTCLMNEDVLSAVVRGDEPPALGDVEPLAATSPLLSPHSLIPNTPARPTRRAWNNSHLSVNFI